MPDLSKIKLDGTTYNLKDTVARDGLNEKTELFIVNCTRNGDNFTTDKTYAETYTAFNAGKIVILRTGNDDIYLTDHMGTYIGGGKISNNQNIVVNWTEANGISVTIYTYTTTSEVNSLITSAIGNINSFEVSVVASLPVSDIDTHTIYFISNSSSGDSIYDEYMYIDNNWEKIGSTAVDLSNYLQKTDISDWAKQTTKPTYIASEVGAISNTEPAASITQTNIDNWTKKSNLFTVSSSSTDNDYWWKLKIDRSNLFAFTNAPGSEGYLRSIDLPVNNGNTYATIQFPTASGKLALVSDIYSVVPDWARENTKPTYTASEVGAATSDHTHTEIGITGRDNLGKVATTSESVQIDAYKGQGGSSNITLKPGKIELLASAKGSTNNTTSIIFSTQSYESNDKIQHIKLSDGATTINGVVTPTTNDMAANKLYVDNKFSSITPASIGALPSSTVIPTVPTNLSAFNNDAGYLTSFTETDPTVPAWAKAASKPTYTAAEVGAVPLTSSGNITITNTGKSTSTIQFINDDDNPGLIEILAEEVRINGIPTPTLNNQAVNKKYVDDSIATITHPTNISAFNNDVGYLTSFTETDPTVPAWAKAATKPTYTASEVGAATSNHTHSKISYYGGSGDGYVEVSTDRATIEASTDGGGTQNILTLTGTTTTIHKVVTPTADGDAANKKYVDDSIAAITHPTNVSTFTNDAGYLTLADLPIYDGTIV